MQLLSSVDKFTTVTLSARNNAETNGKNGCTEIVVIARNHINWYLEPENRLNWSLSNNASGEA